MLALDVRYRLGELFCGPGGLALGAKSASVEADGNTYSIIHAWANDYDRDTCDTYGKNICPDRPSTVICKDVRALEFDKLPAIDGLAFGFPCNDFSVVGEQRGVDGPFGPLYSYGVEALKHFRPQWFVAENVGGLRNANDGAAFDLILTELMDAEADTGYTICPHLYRFENYGVPQARHRIIIVGIRNDLAHVFRVPKAPMITRTAREGIEDPPIPEDASNHERTAQAPRVVERLTHIGPGQNAFTADLPLDLQLNVSKLKISQIYRRLDPDKPAYTITGSGGGGTHVYHWDEPRALTNRERARLQTFPDDFVFSGSKESVRRQIGMAVPSDGARVIFEALLKTFAGVTYESEDANIPLPPRLFERTATGDR